MTPTGTQRSCVLPPRRRVARPNPFISPPPAYCWCLTVATRARTPTTRKRAMTLKRLRWELGPVVPDDIRNNMGQHEKEFMSNYDKILMDYTEEVGVDVLSNLTPPKELMVEVRVLQECGEIMTETGSVGDSHGLENSDRIALKISPQHTTTP